MVSLPILDQVAQTLAQDVQQHRIKKLLICNCYGIWEDNPAKLQEIPWRKLLEDTLQRSPTLESLNLQLNQVAKTLSKPVEYAHVANQTIVILEELYQIPPIAVLPVPPAEESTQWFSAPEPTQFHPTIAPSPPLSPANPYEVALQQLTYYPDGTRLKKLAYCLCYNQWPADERQLGAVTWAQIIQILFDLVPSADHLHYLIYQVAQSLSKPQEYVALGQDLWQILLPLYGWESPSPIAPEPPAPISSAPGQADSPDRSAVVAAPDPLPPYDRFGIRAELMKYTNPFMAKVLLFSLIYEPFNLNDPVNSKQWSQLNQCDLDSLLEALLNRYPIASILKENLIQTANQITQKELALQASGTIFRVLKPYCQTGNVAANLAVNLPQAPQAIVKTAIPSLEDIFGTDPDAESLTNGREGSSTIPLFKRGQV